MIKKILLSLDIADEAAAIHLLKTAEALAAPHGAELHALVVVPTYNMPIVGSYFQPTDEQTVLERARDALQAFLTTNAASGSSIKGHIAHGTIYDEIMSKADELETQLIVLGAHRPELSDYLLGPNAARVVRHAKQSVYVVRPDTD